MSEKKMFEKRLEYLLELQAEIQKELYAAPEGTLRICCSESRIQYYHRRKPSEKTGIYLGKKKFELVKKLADKSYYQYLNKSICEEKEAILAYLKKCPVHYPEEIFNELSDQRKQLVTPLMDTDEMFTEKWIRTPFKGKSISSDLPELITNRGEKVRSKSELIIANLLDKRKIPYKYECPLMLKQTGIVYPDFTVLNVRKRKEIYWEHLGMMDDPEYARKAVKKIASYNQNGLYQGDQLIITSETGDYPINMRQIAGILDHMT